MRKQFRVTKKSNLSKKSHTPSTEHSIANTSFNIASAETILIELKDIEGLGDTLAHAAEHLHAALESNRDVRTQVTRILEANTSMMNRGEDGVEVSDLTKQIDEILNHII